MFDETFVRAWRLYLAGSEATFRVRIAAAFPDHVRPRCFKRRAVDPPGVCRIRSERMPTYDAIIVGGGPAGSSCAREMVAAGLDVAGRRSCAVPARQDLRRLDHPAGGGNAATRPQGVRHRHARASRSPVSRLESSADVSGRRDTTAQSATAFSGANSTATSSSVSGARLETGRTLTSLRRDQSTWIVNEQHRTPLLVGAGGHFCPVAKHLKKRPGPEAPVVAAQEIEFPVEPSEEPHYPIAPETPELYFWPDLQGYGWCFRKARHLNVGVGRIGGTRFGEHVRRFVQFLRASGKAPATLPLRWPGHAYLLYGDVRPLIADGVLLVGDAAGLAYPQSGEGILDRGSNPASWPHAR